MCCLLVVFYCILFFFFKQKTAYEMRISDWSSDVCSSDLIGAGSRGARSGLSEENTHGLSRRPACFQPELFEVRSGDRTQEPYLVHDRRADRLQIGRAHV